MSNNMLTQEKLKELLHYNLDTGIFTWKVHRGPSTIGKVAGCLNSVGYVVIRLLGKLYLGHRLAILYVKGYLPKLLVDHIDVVKSNNKYSNLRECSDRVNTCNVAVRLDNTTGVKGVCFVIRAGRSPYYSAYVAGLGRPRVSRTFTLSHYTTKEAALAAATVWVRAVREELHGEYANHG